MIAYNSTVTDENVSVIGRDTVARFGLGAAERAAVIEAEAISTSGERRTAKGIGYMVPEEGWLLHAEADAGCTLALSDLTHADFVIEDNNASWMIHLAVSFTYNYSAT